LESTALQNSPELAARQESAKNRRAVLEPSRPLASRSDAIDALNLNVDGDKGLTMTFVETIDTPDDE
jgi:hypothetical protein